MADENEKSNVLPFNLRGGRGPIDGGPGGPHDSDMEMRVRKFEGVCEDIRNVLTKLEPAITPRSSDMSEIKGKISQMPTNWTLLLGIVSIFGFAFVLLKLTH